MSLSRRSFMRAGGLVLVGTLLDSSIGWAAGPATVIRRRRLWSMGGWNYLEVEAESASASESALRQAVQAIRGVDQTYSVFDARTALARLNTSARSVIPVDHPEMVGAIARSLELAAITGGAFDPTVESLMHQFGYRDPGVRPHHSSTPDASYRAIECDVRRAVVYREDPSLALDSGGWAKGMAADRAARAALAAGAVRAQINCGFDIVRPGRGTWECLIRNPYGSPTDIAVRCRHRYPAVATSANTETLRRRPDGTTYGHLMDPRSGQPAASDLASVTVFADDGFTADALASALFVMGRAEATRWLASRDDLGAVLIPQDWSGETGALLVFGRIVCMEGGGT